ncbi:MAG: ribonuclease HIII [Candidatus Zixiibacteriota bacterium]
MKAESQTYIGTDESGKGDFFGPLVIAGVLVTTRSLKRLEEIGVRDSKRISDNRVTALGTIIRKQFPNSIVVIGPERYNELYDKIRNLNRLLAWGHARAIENILEKQECGCALTDQFGDEKFVKNALLEKGKKIELVQRPKAEEDLAVAAASILARGEFVRRLKNLSKTCGVDLPKGCSSDIVGVGKELTEKFGAEILRKTAKYHFKTTKQILAG